MQATVNENCISCGLCVESCPTVFSMGGDGLAHGGDKRLSKDMNAIRLILAFMLLSVCAMAATGQERRPRTLDDPGNGRRDVFRGKYHARDQT